MTSALDISDDGTVDFYITCLHLYQIRHHPYHIMIALCMMNDSHHLPSHCQDDYHPLCCIQFMMVGELGSCSCTGPIQSFVIQ